MQESALKEKKTYEQTLQEDIDLNEDGKVDFAEFYAHSNNGFHLNFDPSSDADPHIIKGLFANLDEDNDGYWTQKDIASRGKPF